jgi:hypothetical protein
MWPILSAAIQAAMAAIESIAIAYIAVMRFWLTNDTDHQVGASIFPWEKRTARRLWCIRLFGIYSLDERREFSS